MTYPKHILEKKGDSVVGHMKYGTDAQKESKAQKQVAFIGVDQGVGEVPPPLIFFMPVENIANIGNNADASVSVSLLSCFRCCC